jgi:aryl-alcohol dehydrogenase-like predicted oxidoreductase
MRTNFTNQLRDLTFDAGGSFIDTAAVYGEMVTWSELSVIYRTLVARDHINDMTKAYEPFKTGDDYINNSRASFILSDQMPSVGSPRC